MVYSTHNNKDILAEGEYEGFHYAIISYGSHPCAYVEIPSSHPDYKKKYDDIDIEVHGCLTFGDNLDHVIPNDNRYWIGWDYAHVGDYSCLPFGLSIEGKRWTTKEIFEDVKSVIKQLKERGK